MSISGDRSPSSRDYSIMTPSIGRVVHFLTTQGPHAALITAVMGKAVVLHVLPPNEDAYNVADVLEGVDPGTWCWPPRI